MTQAQATATSFQCERMTITTSRSFDDVLARLRERLGIARIEQYPAAIHHAGSSQANFESVVRSQLGPSGFMLFCEIDHSQWLPAYGVRRRVLRLIFGNPLIAITMMRDDVTVGLFAPVEALLIEHEGAKGCTVVYVLPSTLIASSNPVLLPAARDLDNKVDDLIRDATGAQRASLAT